MPLTLIGRWHILLYAKYEYVKTLEKECEKLKSIMAMGSGKSILKRKRKGQFYYYEVVNRGGKQIQKAIPDKRRGEQYYRQYVLHHFACKQFLSVQKELSRLKTDSETLRKMLMQEYEHIQKLPVSPPLHAQNFKVEGLIYDTLRGEKVRSKSEAIIADVLYRHGIDYEYEKVLEADGRTHVDFTVENNIRGCTLYWEHFGRMDDPDYVLDYLKKKKYYESIGIVEGKNFIATYEFYDNGRPELYFDARQAETIVLKYFEVPPGGV